MKEIHKKLSQLRELEILWNERKNNLSDKDKELAELYSLTDNMPRLTWNSDFIIIHANDAFLNPLGYDLVDLLNKPIFNPDGSSDYITPDTLGASYDTVEANLLHGTKMFASVKNKWFAKDGREVPIQWLKGFNHPTNSFGTTQCKFI